MEGLYTQFFRWVHGAQRLLISIVGVLLCSQILIAPAYATGVYEFTASPPADWVLDRADVLSRTNEGKLNTQLSKLAEETGYGVRMVTLHRLDYNETSQTFAEKLFKKWYPSSEAQAKQTVIVIDDITNNIGIRTGQAVKELLPDTIAESITEETMGIPLKEGIKYNQAFLGAGDRLTAILSGEPDPGPPQLKDTVNVDRSFATKEETKASNATIWVIGLLIVATVVPMATWWYYQYMQSR
jgi:uncharacterized protein